MPSFDVVSEFDHHELQNAIDQAKRELTNRFDFRGVQADFQLEDNQIIITSEAEFQIKQLKSILEDKLVGRGIDVRCLEEQPLTVAVHQAKQVFLTKSGLGKDDAKKIVKIVKESKAKVQASIQGEKVRITGKKRDDLQQMIQLIKDSKLELALQFNNFRD